MNGFRSKHQLVYTLLALPFRFWLTINTAYVYVAPQLFGLQLDITTLQQVCCDLITTWQCHFQHIAPCESSFLCFHKHHCYFLYQSQSFRPPLNKGLRSRIIPITFLVWDARFLILFQEKCLCKMYTMFRFILWLTLIAMSKTVATSTFL